MVTGQLVPSNFQQAYIYKSNIFKSPSKGTNPFKLPGQLDVNPELANKPTQSTDVLSQLNQAIGPTQDPASLDIGMSGTLPPISSSTNSPSSQAAQQTQAADGTTIAQDAQNQLDIVATRNPAELTNSKEQDNALKQRDEASKQQADASNQTSRATQQTQAIGNLPNPDGTPGRALSDAVRQTQMEVNSTASEASQAGGNALDKLSTASNALDQTDGLASRADKSFRDAGTQQVTSIIKNLMGTGLSNAGQGLQGFGDKLDDKGTSLIEVGKVLAAIPFTMPIGLMLIGMGNGLRAIGKGMKSTGKSLDTTGIFMQKDAKQMAQTSKKLFQTSATQVERGQATVEATHNTLQNIRSTTTKKLANTPNNPTQQDGKTPGATSGNQPFNGFSQQSLTPNTATPGTTSPSGSSGGLTIAPPLLTR